MGNSNKGSLNKLKPFSYHDLKKATEKFRQENLIGEGRHGHVFKGWIDETTFAPTKPGKGMAVAIKKLIKYKEDEEEWLKEVNYLGQLHHENLVKLIGYCLKGKNRLLVYEFMPKGSLHNNLFTSNEPIPSATRVKIAIGVARGIAFLHSFKENLIYLDLKPSSILLDSDFNAKLSIFGLKMTPDDIFGPKYGVYTKTYPKTRAIYWAPEWTMEASYTPKSEVFSFGVVLFELLTGKRAFENYFANSSDDRRKVYRIKEEWLGDQFSKEGAKAALALAFQCRSYEPEFRPPMVDVLAALEGLHSLGTIPRILRTLLQSEAESHATKPKWVLISTNVAGEDINCEH